MAPGSWICSCAESLLLLNDHLSRVLVRRKLRISVPFTGDALNIIIELPCLISFLLLVFINFQTPHDDEHHLDKYWNSLHFNVLIFIDAFPIQQEHVLSCNLLD